MSEEKIVKLVEEIIDAQLAIAKKINKTPYCIVLKLTQSINNLSQTIETIYLLGDEDE